MEVSSNGQLNLMQPNELILVKTLPLNVKTKAYHFLESFFQLGEAPGLRVAPL